MREYRIIGLILGLMLITGCTVVVQDYPTTPTYGVSDIEWVFYEYYDWDYDLVLHLHSLGYSAKEVSLVLYLAYYGRCEPATIIGWRREGISWWDICLRLRLDPSIFFLQIPHTIKLPPPYGRAYGYYWKNPQTVVLSDTEMVNLIYLKVVSEAYKIPPEEVIKYLHEGKDFDQIVRIQRQAHKPIYSRKGRVIKTPPEPSEKPHQSSEKIDKTKPSHEKKKGKFK